MLRYKRVVLHSPPRRAVGTTSGGTKEAPIEEVGINGILREGAREVRHGARKGAIGVKSLEFYVSGLSGRGTG